MTSTSQPTHIALWREDLDEANAMLIPIAGTVFELNPDFSTRVTLANGRVIPVYECLIDIEAALSVIRVKQDDTVKA